MKRASVRAVNVRDLVHPGRRATSAQAVIIALALSTVATASMAITCPVSNSSPTAAALSVQSMPPTTVASANGITIGK